MSERIIEKKTKKDKRLQLLEKENAKVIICNTPEASLFAELIPNIDKIYKFLRNNVGSEKVELEYFDEKRKDIIYMADKINEFIMKISEEKELKNINKIMIEKR